MRFKHVRIALNAGAGVYKRFAIAMSPRETGTLAKAYAIKVKIPDASYNTAHHGRPAYAVIGFKRGWSRYAASIKGAIKALTPRRAQKLSLVDGRSIGIRTPSRYAHLAGPGRRSTFMQRAALIGARPAANRALWKLQQGIREEQQRLAAENGV